MGESVPRGPPAPSPPRLRPSGGCSRRRRRRGSRRGGGRRSLFGDSGLAHAFENGLKLGQIGRVIAHSRPKGAGAGDGEGRVERETGLDCGMCLVWSTKVREGGSQQEIRCRIISVGLDCPPKPLNRLIPIAEVVLRDAQETIPGVGISIARTEAQGLADVSLCFFGATDENPTKSYKSVCAGKVSIQLQRAF